MKRGFYLRGKTEWLLKGMFISLLCFFCITSSSISQTASLTIQPTLSNNTLKIVIDDNYPPYVFRDASGNVQGILIDQWKLFEKKTHLPVEIHAMDWGKALHDMAQGKYDVIDTVFYSEKRAQVFDFMKPYADIPVPIFFHKNISGISNASSLKGFKVAVKKGDNCIDILKSFGITDLVEYDSYEAIVKDAKEKKIVIFVIDLPPAEYYLYKYGIQDEFKYTEPIYTGQFHRAVKKRDTITMMKVANGFKSISKRELNAIERKWMGTPLIRPEYLRNAVITIALIIILILTLAAWNAVLRHKVREKTVALTRLLDQYKSSEERYRMLAENSHDLIILHDMEGKILYLSPSFKTITGYETEDFLGKSPDILIHPDDVNMAFTQILKLMQTGKDSELFEFRVKYCDGSYRWIESIARPIRNEQRQVTNILSVHRDITERKKAEAEKKQLEAQVQHSQKLESLGILAGGIAHDFNNLLAAILGNIDLALMEIQDNTGIRTYLIEAEKATHRSADLCRQLLAYSGKGRFVISPVNLSDLVSDMTRILELSISKKASLQYHLVKDLPFFEGDDSQIRQIIMNLVLNASESLENREGIIRISTGLKNLKKEYFNECIIQDSAVEGDYVYIEIEDNGCGMSRETQSKIFDPFYTTKFTGRGLGLAAVLGIVRSHKGNIRIYSEPGTGSIFQVFFPVVKGSYVPPRQKSAITEEINNNIPEPSESLAEAPIAHGTILLVDDEESVRNIGRTMLERMGYTVKLAVDGQDALNFIQAVYAHKPGSKNLLDCIILDLTMPKKDGEETLFELSKMNLDIPVIISSGYSETDITERFKGKELAEFIQKPYEYKTLKDILHKVIKTDN
jgi:PAS domain S-box-containing protein